LSPNILDGVYDCGQDPGNWVLWSQEVLAILEARCHDNGEGADWPHGPFGHIYIDLFDPPPDLDAIPDGADHRRLMEPPLRLRGCWRTHDGLDEWLDGDVVTYRQGGILAWGEREEIVLRLYESDGSEDGAWGRRNDVLGFERIRKTDTTGQVVTVSCHPFTNDHPRRRRPDQVAFELKLQTMTWTFPTQQVDQVKIDSRKGNTVWAEHLEPGGRYGIEVRGHFRYAESGKRQDAVYRQRRSGHWQTGDAEPTWGFRMQGRLPWNEDRPPAHRSDHTYRFVGMADGRGRMGFRIEDNEYEDNDGVLEVSIYGPIAV
jgi:hypothetical protein